MGNLSFILVLKKFKRKKVIGTDGARSEVAASSQSSPFSIRTSLSSHSFKETKEEEGVPVLHSPSPIPSFLAESVPKSLPNVLSENISPVNATYNNSTLSSIPEQASPLTSPSPSSSPENTLPSLSQPPTSAAVAEVTGLSSDHPSDHPPVGIFGNAQQFSVNGGIFNINLGSTSHSHSNYTRTETREQPVFEGQNQTALVTGTDSEIYARLLLPKRHGYPLWIPEPYEGLPLEYGSKGVQVGDVGVVNDDGGFEYLFNVCHSADSPVNSDGVPRDFAPFPVRDLNILQQPSRFFKDAYIASSHIKKTVALSTEWPQIHSEMSFTTSRSEGAILVLPEGARRINARNLGKIRQYAIDNAVKWYEYANGQRGWEIQNDALYLITGCDKCTCWALASFSDASEGTISLELLTIKGELEGEESLQYVWNEGCSAAVRTGPHHEDCRLRNVQNQCVFVRGYKIAIGLDAERRRGGAVLSSIVDSSPDSFFTSGGHVPFGLDSGHFSGSGTGAFGTFGSRTGGAQDSEERPVQQVHLDPFPEKRQVFHPSDVINRYLLFKTNARVAITHDDEWCSVLKENETFLPVAQKLLNKVLSNHSVHTTNHAAFLEPFAPNLLQADSEASSEKAGDGCAESPSGHPESDTGYASGSEHQPGTLDIASQQVETPTSGQRTSDISSAPPHDVASAACSDDMSSSSRHSNRSSSSFRSVLERARRSVTHMRFYPSSRNDKMVPAKRTSVFRRVFSITRERQLKSSGETSKDFTSQIPSKETSPPTPASLRSPRPTSTRKLQPISEEPPFLPAAKSSSDSSTQAQQATQRLSDPQVSSLGRPSSGTSSAFTVVPRPQNSIRDAISMLCTELADSPAYANRTEAWAKDWEETGARMRPLVVLQTLMEEELWSTDSSYTEREYEILSRILKDGYILCQLMNKIQLKLVLNPDVEDELSNLIRFRNECLSFGLAPEDVFIPSDLIEPSKDSIVCVANTIVTLINFAYPHIPALLPTPNAASRSRTSSLFSSEADPFRANSHTSSGTIVRTLTTAGTSLTSFESDSDANRSIRIKLGKGKWPDDFLTERRPSVSAEVEDQWPLGPWRSSFVGSGLGPGQRRQHNVLWTPYQRPSSYSSGNTSPLRGRPRSAIEPLGVRKSGLLSSTRAQDLFSSSQSVVIIRGTEPADNFQIGKCLGLVPTSSVSRAFNLNTGETVAIKRLRIDGSIGEEMDAIMSAVHRLKGLSHANIVRFLNVARNADTLDIILEYAENGSLDQILKVFGTFSEQLVAMHTMKIIAGLQYLHQCGVVHGNLKLSNVLTTKGGILKLSDFGMPPNRHRIEAAPNWTAPEVIETNYVILSSDIWSLACTMIEMLTGKPPYGDISDSAAVMKHIVEDESPPIPTNTSSQLAEFLRSCFNKVCAERLMIDMLAELEWLKYRQTSGNNGKVIFSSHILTDHGN